MSECGCKLWENDDSQLITFGDISLMKKEKKHKSCCVQKEDLQWCEDLVDFLRQYRNLFLDTKSLKKKIENVLLRCKLFGK